MSPSSRVRSITFLAVLTLLTACAGTPEPAPLERPIRVLLLGDSISIGYTQHVRELMGDAAHVVRPTNARGGAENCAGTTKGIDHVDRWLALEGGGWDVIHFNFGLHDLKRVKPDTGKNSQDPADPRQAGRPVYRAQLREITAKLYGTGARLVFATTTPFPPGVKPWRDPEDAVRYNRVALEVGGVRGRRRRRPLRLRPSPPRRDPAAGQRALHQGGLAGAGGRGGAVDRGGGGVEIG